MDLTTPFFMNIHYGASEYSFHLVAGIICGAIAASKSRSVLGWFIVGAITSCIGVLIALCVSDLTPIRMIAGIRTPGRDLYTRISNRRARRPAHGEDVPPIPAGKSVDEVLEWYWSESGAPAGPVTRSAMRALFSHGTIDERTLVWRKGFSDWRPYGSCADLV